MNTIILMTFRRWCTSTTTVSHWEGGVGMGMGAGLE